jgi:hypothetical protein
MNSSNQVTFNKMKKLTKLEKLQRRQAQLVRRAQKQKARTKRNVYMHNIAQHAKAKS